MTRPVNKLTIVSTTYKKLPDHLLFRRQGGLSEVEVALKLEITEFVKT